jgi:hypothetical protein
MRSVASSLGCSSFVLTALLLQVGCTGDSNEPTTTAGPTTNATLTTVPGTESDTGSPTTGGSTAGSGSDTASSGTSGSTSSPTTTDSSGTTMPIDTSGTSSTGGTSTTTLTTDSTMGSSTDGPPCDMMMATLKPVVPNMMLVLDKSGSMVANPDGYWDADADPNTPKITRWNSLYEVVKVIVTDFDATINFGANLFPSTSAKKEYTVNACVVNANVEVAVAPMNSAKILNGIPQAGDISLVGGTPTFSGITAALNHLKTLDPMVPRAILLVTDGAANCAVGAAPPPLFENYDQTVHTLVDNAWMMDGIPTYVVGIDAKNVVSGNTQDGNPNNTNTYTKLNELAVQGGKPKDDPVEKFYNAVNQVQLKAALEVIAKDALSCIIPLDAEPAFPKFTKVLVGGKEVPMVMDCTMENGWVYTNPMGPYTAIELCGTACSDLKIAKQADVKYYCDAG